MQSIVFRRGFTNDAERDLAQREAIHLIETASALSGFALAPTDTVTLGIQDNHWEIRAKGREEWINNLEILFKQLEGPNAEKWRRPGRLDFSNMVRRRPIARKEARDQPVFVGTAERNVYGFHSKHVNREKNKASKSHTLYEFGTNAVAAARAHSRAVNPQRTPEFSARYALYSHALESGKDSKEAMIAAMGDIPDAYGNVIYSAVRTVPEYSKMQRQIAEHSFMLRGGHRRSSRSHRRSSRSHSRSSRSHSRSSRSHRRSSRSHRRTKKRSHH